MPCVPLTRLAIALPLSDALEQQVQAAERAQLDLVTVHQAHAGSQGDGHRDLIQRVVTLATATARVGVVAQIGRAVATLPAPVLAPDPVPPAVAQRLGLLLLAADPDAAQLDPRWLIARTSQVADPVPSAEDPAPLANGPVTATADPDLIFVAAASPAAAAEHIGQLRAHHRAGRASGTSTPRIFLDLAVSRTTGQVLTGPPGRLPVIGGAPAQLAAALGSWRSAGADGFRLHPVDTDQDLQLILQGLVTHLREHDAFRRGYETRTLRGHLGLPSPPSPLATVASIGA